MILAIFPKLAIPIMTFFVKIIEIHVKGDFVKIQEFTLVMIFVIFIKNDDLGLK